MKSIRLSHHALNRAALGLLAGASLALAGCATPPSASQAAAPAPTAAAAPAWTFQAQAFDLVPGVYQGAYSTRSRRLYIASAAGRPPAQESRLVAFDPATGRIAAEATPAPQPGQTGMEAVYGIAVDDAHGQIWTTNTHSGSVAVYRQSDLGLVKQFPDKLIRAAREVRVDAAHDRAYVSSPASHVIDVFDTATLQQLPGIPLTGSGAAPKLMAMAVDAAHGRLYTVSLNTGEVFAIDTATGRQVARYTVPGVEGASGLAVDSQGQRLYVAAQKSGNLTILDARDGRVLAQVKTGAGALNVAFDPVHRLAYVANRIAGTVSVVNEAGVIQAQIATGSNPNHIALDPQGTAWALIKKSKTDPRPDRVVRIAVRG
jgi:DNA-binding beta-propeller fold protein YncE